MKKFLFYCISICILNSCFTTQQVHLDDYTSEAINLPFKVANLNIIDGRDTLLPMNWDLKLFATKAQTVRGNPTVTPIHKESIEKIIFNSEDINGVPINLELKVIEGFCEVKADWKSASEFAKFKAEIQLEIPSRNLTYSSNAEMYFSLPTTNATESHVMIMYEQAMKNVTHMLMKSIRDEFNF